jgi:hypothetical protein
MNRRALNLLGAALIAGSLCWLVMAAPFTPAPEPRIGHWTTPSTASR